MQAPAPYSSDWRKIPSISSAEFERFAGLIRDQTGIHLREHKTQLLVARLGHRLRALGLRTFSAYHDFLARDTSGRELLTLINCITTNKTSFFREPHHFEFLCSHVIPRLQARGRRELRIWSAGCSSGEEPYSIAMTAREELARRSETWDLRILASDIDSDKLEQASAGRYSMQSLENVASQLWPKYFLRGYGQFEGLAQVRPELRQTITFRRINLSQPHWGVLERFDVVFCRNVIIYFDQPVQHRIVRGLAAHVRPGGHYFSGHSENLSHLHDVLAAIEPGIYETSQPGASE